MHERIAATSSPMSIYTYISKTSQTTRKTSSSEAFDTLLGDFKSFIVGTRERDILTLNESYVDPSLAKHYV